MVPGLGFVFSMNKNKIFIWGEDIGLREKLAGVFCGTIVIIVMFDLLFNNSLTLSSLYCFEICSILI